MTVTEKEARIIDYMVNSGYTCAIVRGAYSQAWDVLFVAGGTDDSALYTTSSVLVDALRGAARSAWKRARA